MNAVSIRFVYLLKVNNYEKSIPLTNIAFFIRSL